MFGKFVSSSPVSPRDPFESHRAATPLELLFDLVSVIAIAAAAAGLHHAIAEDHSSDGILKFGCTFFAIWWAWVNYTWYASAYDNDDTVFRVLTMITMAGATAMAAGVQPFFHSLDLTLMVSGFVIMRVSMVLLWLRAAYHDEVHRKTAQWYAIGIALAQCYWVGLLLFQPVLPVMVFFSLFGLGALIEISVPIVAEKHGKTSWHRHHIIERYGLLNIIVLGETLLAGSLAIGQSTGDHLDIALIHIALSALVIVFSMWWLYFSKEEHLKGVELDLAFIWGYGHLIIYASGAAVGAGLAVLVDVITHHSHISLLAGDFAVAIPASCYLIGLWFVRDRYVLVGKMRHVLLIFSVLILVIPPILGLEGIALILFLSVVLRSRVACRKAQTTKG